MEDKETSYIFHWYLYKDFNRYIILYIQKIKLSKYYFI